MHAFQGKEKNGITKTYILQHEIIDIMFYPIIIICFIQ